MSSELLANIFYFVLAFTWTMYIAQELFIAGGSALNMNLSKTEDDRKQIQVSTGLHFDGMEVWFIAALAFTEGTFPAAFSTIFSHLYVIIFLLVYAIITRGIAIQVIYRIDHPKWIKSVVTAWTISSISIIFLLGIYISNLFLGYPLGATGMEEGFLSVISVSSISAGLLFVALGFTSGAAWIKFNVDGELGERALEFIKKVGIIYMIPLFLLLTLMGLNNTSSSIFIGELFTQSTAYFFLPAVSIVSAILVTWYGYRKQAKYVFIFSLLTVVFYMITGYIGNYPYLVPSSIDSMYGLTILGTVVSERALRIVLVAVFVFYPVVIGYQLWKYIRFTKQKHI